MGFGIRGTLFMGVLLAMPVASYWYVFRPSNEQIGRAKKEIEQKELMLRKLEVATAQTEDLERANEAMAEQIRLIESRLPTTKEVDVILEQVSTLAKESKLAIPKVKAQPPLRSAQYMEQPLDMTVTGDFDDFYVFLQKVEKLSRITRILDLKLERSKDEDGIIEAEFTLSIFFKPDEKAGGAA